MAVPGAVEIDLLELVDHLPKQSARLHVAVGILEDAADHGGGIVALPAERQLLERGKELVVHKAEEFVARHPFRVLRPVPPAQALRDGRAVVVLEEFTLVLAGMEDLEEKQPAELAETLRIAVHPDVLAHDVLDGLDRRRNTHLSSVRQWWCNGEREEEMARLPCYVDLGIA